MTISKKIRSAIREALKGTDYDTSTIRITADGIVTAIKDADKTFNGPETVRYNVGHWSDIVTADGQIKQGW